MFEYDDENSTHPNADTLVTPMPAGAPLLPVSCRPGCQNHRGQVWPASGSTPHPGGAILMLPKTYVICVEVELPITSYHITPSPCLPLEANLLYALPSASRCLPAPTRCCFCHSWLQEHLQQARCLQCAKELMAGASAGAASGSRHGHSSVIIFNLFALEVCTVRIEACPTVAACGPSCPFTMIMTNRLADHSSLTARHMMGTDHEPCYKQAA